VKASIDTLLEGKVVRRRLPELQPGPASTEVSLKRLTLPQGELAQFHDSDEPMRYMASIELKSGTVRGNHYHKIKREYVYVVSGEIRLALQDLETNVREVLEISAGDLILIQPGVVHALEIKKDGMAIEFSPNRFDPKDTYRTNCL
jgi:dTDP-4-dehydrorhamnose 3,5-epimerase-like enzyme